LERRRRICWRNYKLAFDNDCWNNEALGLALMLSTKSYKCCETESTILEVLNSFVTKKDGSNFKKFNKQEQKYVDIILNSGIYEKYKNKDSNVVTYKGKVEYSEIIDNENVLEFEFVVRKDVKIMQELYNYGKVKIVENSDFPLIVICNKQVKKLDSRLLELIKNMTESEE